MKSPSTISSWRRRLYLAKNTAHRRSTADRRGSRPVGEAPNSFVRRKSKCEPSAVTARTTVRQSGHPRHLTAAQWGRVLIDGDFCYPAGLVPDRRTGRPWISILVRALWSIDQADVHRVERQSLVPTHLNTSYTREYAAICYLRRLIVPTPICTSGRRKSPVRWCKTREEAGAPAHAHELLDSQSYSKMHNTAK